MNVIDKSKQRIDGVISKSKEHYESANETYLEHMKVAIKISFELFLASMMACIHAIIPAIFQKGASGTIIKLYEYLQSKKRVDK
tara:strand:- start:288 stop:539 length:252 start_codon:yes stop_codon:yes gene_type:complete